MVLHGICEGQLNIVFDERYFGPAARKIDVPGLRTCGADNPSAFAASLPLKTSPVGLRPREDPVNMKNGLKTMKIEP